MNGQTVRKLLRCGYSVYSKDRSVPWMSSRILYNQTARRDYCSSWSMQQQQKNTFLSPANRTRHWNVNCVLVNDLRNLSTSLPHNGQTALKPKSPEHENGKKQSKAKPIASDKVEIQSKIDREVDNAVENTETVPQTEEKLTLTAKFKKMYKEYWYVLLPVHVVTSTFWLGGFYYLSTSGVDIPAMLESLHFSESTISSLRDSSMGHVAIAYLCYKIATPIRYTVTLGGTTLSIKYLSQWGYIRPVPSKAQLKQMYDDQKAKFQHKD